MNSYIRFLVYWLGTVCVASVLAVWYLAANPVKRRLSTRVLLKAAPLFVVFTSALAGLASGWVQRTAYTGLLVGFMAACLVGDCVYCISDFYFEHERVRDGYLMRGVMVVAFAAAHVALLVAMCVTGGDLGVVGWALAIPFAVVVFLVALALYERTTATAAAAKPRLSWIEYGIICVYAALLLAVAWRAAARIGHRLDVLRLDSELEAFIGVLVFAASDFFVLLGELGHTERWLAVLALAVYWSAQCLLYLSTFLYK